MSPTEFENRVEKEMHDFLRLYGQVGVDQKVQITEPKLGPAFAEELILCPDTDSARKRIAEDPAGSEGFVELVQNLLHAENAWQALAANMPAQDLTPFYLLCSVVIDVARNHPEVFEDDNEDSGEPSAP